MIGSTRLAFVSSKSLDQLTLFIQALPFKVELKSLVVQGGRFYQTFVLPDEATDFANVNL